MRFPLFALSLIVALAWLPPMAAATDAAAIANPGNDPDAPACVPATAPMAWRGQRQAFREWLA